MKSVVKEKLELLTSLPFPAFAEDDALSDWQSELAELDGYLAGLASTTLGGERVNTSMVSRYVRQARAGLEEICVYSCEDRQILAECKTYMSALEDLAQELCR